MKRILIVYYSRKGENYVNGDIINLKVGNTYRVAQYIQEYTNGDLHEIETMKQYPQDYHQCTIEAKEELNQKIYPDLKHKINNFKEYDVIFLGYPNWWGTYPMAVATFLKEYQPYHQTIIPFCTHEGSGMGHSMSDLKKACPYCEILSGIEIKGSHAQNSLLMIKGWLESIKEYLI